MPAKRIFTQTELDLALAMTRACESWRAIGRALRCNEDTIRRQFEPEYGMLRMGGIVSRKRERRAAARSIQRKAA